MFACERVPHSKNPHLSKVELSQGPWLLTASACHSPLKSVSRHEPDRMLVNMEYVFVE
jgi:hypothetical protein